MSNNGPYGRHYGFRPIILHTLGVQVAGEGTSVSRYSDQAKGAFYPQTVRTLMCGFRV